VAFVADSDHIEVAFALHAERSAAVGLADVGAAGPAADENDGPFATVRVGDDHRGVAIALALYLVGTYGWFGSPREPLAAVFLVPLGLPWILWLDVLPSAMLPTAAIAAPALNLILLWSLCRWRARR